MVAKREALARARKSAGHTQESVARELNVDPSSIQRWEAGTRTPYPYLRPKLAALLSISREKLDALLMPPVATPTTSEVTVPDDDGAERAAKAVRDGYRYFDGSVVQYFRSQLTACMADDGQQGPTKTLPAVLGLLRAIEQQARDVRPSVRVELLSFGACGAEFAGWLYRDTNNPVLAAFWYDRAMEWAQEACDLPLQGYVLLKKSQMAYDERDALRVYTLIGAAEAGPWQLPPKVRAEVTQQQARALAMIGEPLVEVERKLEQSRVWLTQATDVPSDSPLSSHYSAVSLTLQTASCYIEAGQPRRAAELYDETFGGHTLSRRDQGYFLARRTSALALAGEPDDAAQVGLEAAQIATETGSLRTKRELRRALQTLEPWRSRPGPKQLREAVRA
ncbi:helix-turn-helix domain-containing protein [Amycolatopsis sp. H20-H5]|uniref:helix-turn-helix domain-containing protein n=1 Tax=Amycolatopsis sp. H20-H5 TaxID=3046309 RepID=UPI002DBDF16C|nr:helix-turn-helix transcriptional regulator [Amycolatopsis sp. H20-H5]MEC3978161.1 helix-turn-helix transcriptional regulator [Amycolatopsis sp. H20-H5]